MNFVVPPENQGQIIENAYCLFGDYVYKRVYSRATLNRRGRNASTAKRLFT